MSDRNREAFEAWAKQNHLPLTEWSDTHGPYYTDQQTYAAWGAWQAASKGREELLEALAKGYSGSTMVSDADGGKLCIYYDNPDDAEAAHDALCKAVSAVIQKNSEGAKE